MKKKTSRSKNNIKKKPSVSLWFKDLDIVVKASFFLSFMLIFWAVYAVKADNQGPIVYEQKFERSPIDEASPDGESFYNYDWFAANGENVITQVEGNNSIGASSGDYYGVVNKALSYSKFGECDPNGPSDRWLTQIDVYLDTNWELGAGFDYVIETKAFSTEGDDLRYSTFHVTKDTSLKKILIGASAETNGWPKEDLEGDNHYVVKKSGWFTLRSKLRSVDNILIVDMSVLDSSKRVVWQDSLTKNDFSYDVASLSWNCRAGFPVLYNGYTINDPESNLPFEEPGFDLPIDNHKLILYNELDVVGPPLTKEECYDDGWKIFDWETFSEPTFKSQGDCVSYIESNEGSPGN